MQVFSIQESDIKNFMQHLFALDSFNCFQVRGITIHSFTYFEISGEKTEGYCTWEELSPYVRNILKGRDKPRAMKFVFAHGQVESVHPNAAALFININYEGDKITCTTATSQKNFDLNRQVDTEWDTWVKAFFMQKKINIVEGEI